MSHPPLIKQALGLLFALILFTPFSVQAQSLSTSDEAKLNLRMNSIEDQMRRMNGDVERLSFEIRRLTERLTKFTEDIEFRLKDLKAGKPAPSPSSAPAPGPAPGSGPVKLGPTSDSSTNNNTDPTRSRPRILGQIPADGSVEGAQVASLNAKASEELPQKGLYELSYERLHAKDYAGAERGFKSFIQQNPKSDLISNAHYWLGESYYARRQYKDAARFFLKGFKQYPKGRKAPDNLFKLGMTLKKLGQKDQACAAYSETKRRYPKADKDLKKRLAGEIRKSGC